MHLVPCPSMTGRLWPDAGSGLVAFSKNVRYWHLADMLLAASSVRFQG